MMTINVQLDFLDVFALDCTIYELESRFSCIRVTLLLCCWLRAIILFKTIHDSITLHNFAFLSTVNDRPPPYSAVVELSTGKLPTPISGLTGIGSWQTWKHWESRFSHSLKWSNVSGLDRSGILPWCLCPNFYTWWWLEHHLDEKILTRGSDHTCEVNFCRYEIKAQLI